jgi:hypothetical protein
VQSLQIAVQKPTKAGCFEDAQKVLIIETVLTGLKIGERRRSIIYRHICTVKF